MLGSCDFGTWLVCGALLTRKYHAMLDNLGPVGGATLIGLFWVSPVVVGWLI